jgi:hypothetical protein
VPTFCRHGRFLERCPICSKTLPGNAPARSGAGGAAKRRSAAPRATARRRGRSEEGLRVSRQQRAVEDGYSSPLLPGLRASADAERLADELAFAHGRLLVLGERSSDARLPRLYADVRALAVSALEQATWTCFLIAYLCPTEGAEPFAGIRLALGVGHAQLPNLEELPLGPRSAHERARGAETLRAYRSWYEQAGGQARAFTGDVGWSPQRRFERVFERLALPGLTRAARYELLVLLGTLGLYELQASSLQLAGGRGSAAQDATTLAAKRVFAIGDVLLLERRARALAKAVSVPVAALDLALSNWSAAERATLGFAADVSDAETLRRAREALGL